MLGYIGHSWVVLSKGLRERQAHARHQLPLSFCTWNTGQTVIEFSFWVVMPCLRIDLDYLWSLSEVREMDRVQRKTQIPYPD